MTDSYQKVRDAPAMTDRRRDGIGKLQWHCIGQGSGHQAGKAGSRQRTQSQQDPEASAILSSRQPCAVPARATAKFRGAEKVTALPPLCVEFESEKLCFCTKKLSKYAYLLRKLKMAIERTLSIIKPDAVAKNVIGQIYAHFEAAGLKVVAARMAHLSRLEAERFMRCIKSVPFFNDLVSFMISGPVMISSPRR